MRAYCRGRGHCAGLRRGFRSARRIHEMHREMLRYMVRQHTRANERILETTTLLTDDEYRRPALLDHGSAHETLLHMLVVDWGWRESCIGNDDEDSYPEG